MEASFFTKLTRIGVSELLAFSEKQNAELEHKEGADPDVAAPSKYSRPVGNAAALVCAQQNNRRTGQRMNDGNGPCRAL